MMEKALTVVEKLAEASLLPFVLLLLAGAALLALAAAGAVPAFSVELTHPGWRNVVGASGVVMLSAALILAFVGVKASTRKSISKKDVEISIDSPGDGNSVEVPCRVKGKCIRLPQGTKLWLFTVGQGERYWPQDDIEVKADKTWETELRATNFTRGERKKFAIFCVGKDGQALIKHYKVAGASINAIEPKRDDRKWPAIEMTTSDMVAVTDSREVTLIGRKATT